MYYVSDCKSQLGGNVPSVTNLASFMAYEKSQGIRYIIVKAGTGSTHFNGGGSSPQLNTTLVNAAHTAGLLIFAYTRSYGADIPGESSLVDYCFDCGADGFVLDGEAYRVQYRDSLAALVWSSLLANVTATGSTASELEALAAPQRFYRILNMD